MGVRKSWSILHRSSRIPEASSFHTQAQHDINDWKFKLKKSEKINVSTYF